jgi:hypothetical protein
MESDVEIERALAAITATLNDQGVEEFDRDRVQGIATGSAGGAGTLTVDSGGGIHDESGARVACVRKTTSGEWIAERQNTAADNSDVAVPSPAPRGEQKQSLVEKLDPRK